MEKGKKNVEFHACPSDCELIMQLLKFVAGKRCEGFIGFTDVYSKEPWELIGESSKKTHYLFTQLKKKNKSDTRFNRTTRGGGSWIQQAKGKFILDEDEKLVIGYKRSLNFKHKKNRSLNGQWVMKEYVLADFLLRQLKSNDTKDFVICAIKRNPRSVIKVSFLFVGVEQSCLL
ncbi:NAC domain-containing protein 6-like [Solanum dulcamara]|uniref:NAC domain-containing protein 6-like n=1 Tax=Solanum dulcamara TaxID=45834 RepID=UPI002484DB0C|nr:NAC domain-containing protein 6-like [Solanum dulcamara]